MAHSHTSSKATTLITPTIIAKEALMMLTNNMVMGRLVHREYKNEFNKVGTSINLRKPVKFAATESATRTNTSIVEYAQAFTVTQQVHVSWAFSSAQLTMTIDEYSKRYITPAANTLANYVDVDLCNLYDDVGGWAGTHGTTPNSYSDLGDAQTILDNNACPVSGRVAVLNPAAHWAMADGLKGTFAQKPANDIHTKGYLGTVANLDMHMDQNIARHLTGAFTTSSTPLMSATVTAGGYVLPTDGWSSGAATLKAGDTFTVGSSSSDYVYGVNPVSGVSTGVPYQFVNLNDESPTGTTIAALDIFLSTSAGCQTSGQYKNMSIYPQNGSAINMNGTESSYYPQNLIFHPNAFGLVMMPLAMPAGVWGSRVTDKQAGVSIRVVKDYDIYYDEEIIRMDILYGVSTLYPELACRLVG